MMHPRLKFKIFFVSLLAISSTLSAMQTRCSALVQDVAPCYISQPLVEIKTGYFFFTDSKMRQVYDKGGLDIQLCASYPLWNLTSRWTLNAYGAVEYLHLSGKSKNDSQKTSLWSIPVNIGLKSIYAIHDSSQYYFTLGPRYFYIHQHNDSPYVYKNRSRNGFGFFVNTGVNYRFCNHFVIDVFGEYSYGKMQFNGGRTGVYTRNIQVGGITLGGALGYQF